MENNNNNTNSKPVLLSTHDHVLIAEGREVAKVLVDVFSNKDYFRIRTEFPNGSFTESFYSWNRVTNIKQDFKGRI